MRHCPESGHVHCLRPPLLRHLVSLWAGSGRCGAGGPGALCQDLSRHEEGVGGKGKGRGEGTGEGEEGCGEKKEEEEHKRNACNFRCMAKHFVMVII